MSILEFSRDGRVINESSYHLGYQTFDFNQLFSNFGGQLLMVRVLKIDDKEEEENDSPEKKTRKSLSLRQLESQVSNNMSLKVTSIQGMLCVQFDRCEAGTAFAFAGRALCWREPHSHFINVVNIDSISDLKDTI